MIPRYRPTDHIVRFRPLLTHVLVVAPGLACTALGCGSVDPGPSDAGDANEDTTTDGGFDAPDAPDALDAPDPFDSPTDAPFDQLADTEQGPDSDVADAMPQDASADATPDAKPDAPWPPQCGDGYRDPTTEECDDGLGVTPESRACTESCEVTDRLVALDSEVQERWLGSAEAAASGPAGHAVAVIEHLAYPNHHAPRVAVVLFDMAGRRTGISHLTTVSFDAAPALAALPDGTFALVMSRVGLNAEGLGVGLYRIPATGGLPAFATVANESMAYGQHGAVAAWDGSALLVAWLDDSPALDPTSLGRRVCLRRFDSQLQPLGQEACFEESPGWPSDLRIAVRGSTHAVGWREADGYVDRIVVRSGPWGSAWSWTSEELIPTAAQEPPALAWLDDDHLLLVATEGDGVQRATMFHNGLALGSFDEVTTLVPRYEPILATTQDGVYLAWSEPEDLANGGWTATLAEVWLQKLDWTGTEIDWASNPVLPLPRDPAHRLDDQHRPALRPVVDATQPAPGGALLAFWNDLTSDNFTDQAVHGDVVVELIPTPIVRGLVH